MNHMTSGILLGRKPYRDTQEKAIIDKIWLWSLGHNYESSFTWKSILGIVDIQDAHELGTGLLKENTLALHKLTLTPFMASTLE